MTDQVSDVVNLILDHCGSLQRQSKSDDVNTIRETHRQQHLRTEHTLTNNVHKYIVQL